MHSFKWLWLAGFLVSTLGCDDTRVVGRDLADAAAHLDAVVVDAASSHDASVEPDGSAACLAQFTVTINGRFHGCTTLEPTLHVESGQNITIVMAASSEIEPSPSRVVRFRNGTRTETNVLGDFRYGTSASIGASGDVLLYDAFEAQWLAFDANGDDAIRATEWNADAAYIDSERNIVSLRQEGETSTIERRRWDESFETITLHSPGTDIDDAASTVATDGTLRRVVRIEDESAPEENGFFLLRESRSTPASWDVVRLRDLAPEPRILPNAELISAIDGEYVRIDDVVYFAPRGGAPVTELPWPSAEPEASSYRWSADFDAAYNDFGNPLVSSNMQCSMALTSEQSGLVQCSLAWSRLTADGQAHELEWLLFPLDRGTIDEPTLVIANPSTIPDALRTFVVTPTHVHAVLLENVTTRETSDDECDNESELTYQYLRCPIDGGDCDCN